nr:unnamed protein product [Callosobruchus chinensis]
MQAPLKKH